LRQQKVAENTLLRIMSASQDSIATTIAAQAAQPKDFFSLPGELRNQIYDILHQHEESTRFHSLTFRYTVKLSHLRLISRQFTAEFDRCTPISSRLVISQTSRNQIWYPQSQPVCLPKALDRRIFRELEFNIDVCDTYHKPIERLSYFHRYTEWLSKLYHRDLPMTQIMSPTRTSGQLHLRFFFNYVSNLKRLQDEISLIDWYGHFCTQISLVYDGDKLLREQTVATRSGESGWETDETFIEQGRAEWAIGRQQADCVAVSESV
jgi:hypothetical protein